MYSATRSAYRRRAEVEVVDEERVSVQPRPLSSSLPRTVVRVVSPAYREATESLTRSAVTGPMCTPMRASTMSTMSASSLPPPRPMPMPAAMPAGGDRRDVGRRGADIDDKGGAADRSGPSPARGRRGWAPRRSARLPKPARLCATAKHRRRAARWTRRRARRRARGRGAPCGAGMPILFRKSAEHGGRHSGGSAMPPAATGRRKETRSDAPTFSRRAAAPTARTSRVPDETAAMVGSTSTMPLPSR